MKKPDTGDLYPVCIRQILIWVCCGILATMYPGIVWGWSAEDHEEIVADAIRLAPTEIRDFLTPSMPWLKDGASAPPRVFRDCENHGFTPQTAKGRGPGAMGPNWSAVPRAMELYAKVVADLKVSDTPPEVIARRIGILSHYVSSIIQPPRTAWNCNAEGRYVQPVYLGWDDQRIPIDVEAELIAAGQWANEIDGRSPKLDSLYYASAVSLTARIWTAAWQAAGREVMLGSVASTALFNPGGEILLRAMSLVEYCQDRLRKAQDWHLALWLGYPLYTTRNEIALAEAYVNFWKKKLDEAVLWEAEKKTPSPEELQRRTEELEKGRKEGLEILEESVTHRDGTLFINGRFLNHGPNPVTTLNVMVRLFDDQGVMIKQTVYEHALNAGEPEGFLPGTIHRFRITLRQQERPKFSSAHVVFLRSSSDRGDAKGKGSTF